MAFLVITHTHTHTARRRRVARWQADSTSGVRDPADYSDTSKKKKIKNGTDEQAAAAVLEMARVRKRQRPKRSVRLQPNPSLATILNARAQFPPNIPTPTKVHILTRDQC